MSLRQVASVEQYQDSFDALLTRIDDLPVRHAISCLSGLFAKIESVINLPHCVVLIV